jgi:transcriptional regulator with XRE-family HTH domain
MKSKQLRVSTNVRFLLWKAGVRREEWVSWLESRSALGLYRARDLVAGLTVDDAISESELLELARLFDLGAEGESLLRFDDFTQTRVNVLTENLRFLLDQLPHGGKQQLARQVGVDPATISRWRSGSHSPEGPSLRSLILAFGLPAETDLKRDALFLSAEPISGAAQRKWLHERIENLSPNELHAHFASLKRLLEDR